MRSKEEQVLELFFNSSRHWHFEELLEKVKISRAQLAQWLKRFEKEGIILRMKEEGKMPHYNQYFESPGFQNRKKLYAMKRFYESGFLNHLASLAKARVIILFGSFSRADWHEDSDIDVFIYGKDDDFEQGKYEVKLKREIQVHNARNMEDLKRMDKLLPYIVSGDFIKGSIEDLKVHIGVKA